eukprot:COSAG04_NODE_16242_length_505_cov_1.261084_1_plen_103_part_10
MNDKRRYAAALRVVFRNMPLKMDLFLAAGRGGGARETPVSSRSFRFIAEKLSIAYQDRLGTSTKTMRFVVKTARRGSTSLSTTGEQGQYIDIDLDLWICAVSH